MAIGFTLFWVCIVVMELLTGCAVIGWVGDNMVVRRERTPGPFWFAITIQGFMGITLTLLLLFAE